MLAIVVSEADEASVHVGEHLLEQASWTAETDDSRPAAAGGGTVHRADGVALRTFEGLHLHTTGAAAAFDDPDLLVFASRHAGETGDLLTAHATGNFGPAEYGGEAGSLALAAPNALDAVRSALASHAPAGYDVGVECTHHGPSEVGCPSLFVELGSDESAWADPEGAAAVARAILALRGVEPVGDRVVVGFGGGHYAPRFDRILTETGWSVGHVAADWALEAMGDPGSARDVVASAFRNSGAEHALVDGDRPGLERVIADLGYRVVSETWLREADGVPLSLVDRLEAALGPVDEGLRFGSPATSRDGGSESGTGDGSEGGSDDGPTDDRFVVETLPAELLAEATGIDREAVLAGVDERALAYGTEEGGSVVAGPVALPDADASRELVAALAGALEDKYDDVTLTDGAVVARRETFDPELARQAGVEEGPAFGRLAAGEAVETEQGVVEPAEVRSARERRFPI